MENNNPPIPPVPPNPNEDDLNKQFNEQFGNQNNPNQNRNTNIPGGDQNNPNKINQNVNPYQNVNPQQNVNPGGGNFNQGPYNQGGFNQGPYNQGPYNQGNMNVPPGGYNPAMGKGMPLPNAGGVLALGICSLVLWLCYSIPGLICAIIALVLAKKANEQYAMNPGMYDASSYNNMKAGRVCAIIGLCLSILYFLVVLIIVIVAVSAAGSNGFRY